MANSYVYGPGMGGTAPVEQISGSGAVSFCFSAPSGVQAVVTKATSSTDVPRTFISSTSSPHR